jgi:hypothetical protein
MAASLKNAKVDVRPICPPESHGGVIQEVTIDPRRIGRPYRFIYGLCIRGPRPCNVLNACCRVDILSSSVAMWSEPGVLPAGGLVRPCPFLLFSTWLHTFVPNRSSDPRLPNQTFLPRPGAAEDDETDGVLLVDLLGADGLALVVVLDGASFQERARVTLPFRQTFTSYRSTFVWDNSEFPAPRHSGFSSTVER